MSRAWSAIPREKKKKKGNKGVVAAAPKSPLHVHRDPAQLTRHLSQGTSTWGCSVQNAKGPLSIVGSVVAVLFP
jgi:hypothetical protein